MGGIVNRNKVFVALAVLIVFALIAAYAAWAEFTADTSWRKLHARYPATESWGEFRHQRTMEMRGDSKVAIGRFPQRVTVEWRKSSLFLGQSTMLLGRRLDLDFAFPIIEIPAEAVKACRIATVSADIGVEFVIDEAGVRLGFPGYGTSFDQQLIDGCREHGVVVLDERTMTPAP